METIFYADIFTILYIYTIFEGQQGNFRGLRKSYKNVMFIPQLEQNFILTRTIEREGAGWLETPLKDWETIIILHPSNFSIFQKRESTWSLDTSFENAYPFTAPFAETPVWFRSLKSVFQVIITLASNLLFRTHIFSHPREICLRSLVMCRG